MRQKPKTSNSVVAYVRVSTEEQAVEGVSLEAQEARLRAYCTLRGMELADVVVDAGVSAGKPLSTREGGARLLEMIRFKKVDSVVALKLDRLFRNAADCLNTVEAWDRAGIPMHLVDIGGASVDTSSAMGRFFLTIMAGAAEMERNMIRERTSFAMQHMASRGEYTGGHSPYGTTVDDGKLTEAVEERQVIDKARELRALGMSLRKVATELAHQGHLSRTGKPFVPCQIAKMVRVAEMGGRSLPFRNGGYSVSGCRNSSRDSSRNSSRVSCEPEGDDLQQTATKGAPNAEEQLEDRATG